MKSKVAVVAMVCAAALGMTTQAEAAPSGEVSASAGACRDVRFLTGGEGHRGVSVRCEFGRHFRAVVGCKKRDNGFKYTHVGNRVPNGAWSTAWCDRNADVELWGGYSD